MNKHTCFNNIKLMFENDTGQIFNGVLAEEDKKNVITYISQLNNEYRETFLLEFVKTTYLTDEFLKNGADFESLYEIMDWLQFEFM